jgi:hypothetical protein
MALQSIELTSAERNLLEYIFGTLASTKADTARMVKAIRTAFETKSVNKRIDKYDIQARRMGLPPLSWGNLVDPNDYLEGLDDLLAELKDSFAGQEGHPTKEEQADVERLGKLMRKFEGIIETRTFTLDSLYLRWLRDLLTDKVDLSKRHITNQMGQVTESIVPPNPDQIAVFSGLTDKIDDAVKAAAKQEVPGGDKS